MADDARANPTSPFVFSAGSSAADAANVLRALRLSDRDSEAVCGFETPGKQLIAACRTASAAAAAVVALMRERPGDAQCQSECCYTLASFADGSTEQRTAAGEAGAADAVVAAMCMHHAAGVQVHGCMALCNLMKHHVANETKALAAGAVPAALCALKAYPRDTVVQCEGLNALCACMDPQRITVAWRTAALDIITAALAALRTHSGDHGVVRNSLCALRMCVDLSDESRAAAVSAGALPAVVAAMRAQLADTMVQCAGCVTMQALLGGEKFGGGGPRPSARDRQLATDAVSTLLAALKAHVTEPNTQEQACLSLCRMAAAADESIKGREAFRAVVAALRTHAASPHVQAAACSALAGLCSGAAAKKQAAACAAGALDAAVAALLAHPDDDAVQEYGCLACAHLMAPGHAAQAAAIAAGVLQAAMRALRRPSLSVHAPALMTIVGLLSENAAAARAAGAAGAIEAVASAILAARSFPDVAHADRFVQDTARANGFGVLHQLICCDGGDNDDVGARERRAVCAGAVEALRTLRSSMTTPTSVVTALVARLEAAARRHDDDAARCDAGAACKRCGSLRASGAMCALLGCGARARARARDGDGAAKSLLRCGACRAEAYCSVAHQRADWARHKVGCRSAA
jgi:hypothetical protein